MDAVKYIEEKERMCKSFPDCGECPIWKSCDPNAEDAREAVAAVEKWSREHPVVTNGDKVKALLPIREANISISPFDDCVHITIAKSWWDEPYEGE